MHRTVGDFLKVFEGLVVRIWTKSTTQVTTENGAPYSLVGRLHVGAEFIMLELKDEWTMIPLIEIALFELEPPPDMEDNEVSDDPKRKKAYGPSENERKFEEYYQKKRRDRES